MDPNCLLPRHEIERYFSLENARDKVAAEYAQSPLDAENLTKWGALLLELAQLRQGQSSLDMVEEARSKFEEALKLEPKRHYTRWCLGNAYTSEGFLESDGTIAYSLFKQATQCFQQALDQDQDNMQYLRSLEMSLKAPSMYHEFQKQQRQAAKKNMNGGVKQLKGGSTRKGSKGISSDVMYDVVGWVMLAFGIALCVRMFRNGFPAPVR